MKRRRCLFRFMERNREERKIEEKEKGERNPLLFVIERQTI